MAKKPDTSTAKAKRYLKNEQSFIHDLYKLDVAPMKKNASYRKYEPWLSDLEHVHIYHSHSTDGEKQKYCAPVGGHFHEVTPYQDQDGNMRATCGPALRKVDKKDRMGRFTQAVEQVYYLNGSDEDKSMDSHIHEVIYKGSEEISAFKIKESQLEDKQKLSSLMAVSATAVKKLDLPSSVPADAEILE